MLAKPFHIEVVNILCAINECTLGVISFIQTVFISDIKEAELVAYTGWLMISLVLVMTIVNFCIVFSYSINLKIKSIKSKRLKKIANEVDPVVDMTTTQMKETSTISTSLPTNMTLKEEHKIQTSKPVLF